MTLDRPRLGIHRRERLALGLLLGGVAVALFVTVVPGVFIIDEDHYLASVLALRSGGLHLPGTEGLPPSKALRWFDPWGHRLSAASPVPATVPPLYAPLALPFALLGWRALFALNVLSFAALALVLFVYVRWNSREPATAWIALGTYLAGGYAVEYAQAMWPHLLAALLTTGAVVLASRASERGAALPAAFAGLCAGLATGIRYQEIVVAAAVGLGLLLLARDRLRAVPAYAVGLAMPLVVIAAINAQRIGTPNPITKGEDYLESPARTETPRRVVADAARMTWARVVDFSKRPPIGDPRARIYIAREDRTGAYLYEGTIKKSWLQSAPWIVVALLAGSFFGRALRPGAERSDRETLRIALVLGAVLAAFALADPGRHDGLSYNQRYFVELVPLAAALFAWALEDRRIDARLLAGAAAASAVVCGVWLDIPFTRTLRAELVMRSPLLIAAALGLAWLLAPRGPTARRACALLGGLAIGWAAAIHALDDLPASRGRRAVNLALARAYDRDLPAAPERSAAIVYWGAKDAAGPLLFERDLVVADIKNDEGATLAALVESFLDAGRRVFVSPRMPPGLVDRQLAGRCAGRPGAPGAELYEIVPAGAGDRPGS
jgi:hypothetical protein